jgi:YggT family protein
MLFQILNLLLQAAFGLLILVFLVRFWMLTFRVSFHNPVGGAVLALSDWIVLPARRIVPSMAGLDMSSLLCALLAQVLLQYLELLLKELLFDTVPALSILSFISLALLELLRWSVCLLIGVVLLQVLISWINPYSTVGPSLAPILRPFYRPIRRVIPPIRRIDLSPLVLLLALQIVLILLAGLHSYLLTI